MSNRSWDEHLAETTRIAVERAAPHGTPAQREVARLSLAINALETLRQIMPLPKRQAAELAKLQSSRAALIAGMSGAEKEEALRLSSLGAGAVKVTKIERWRRPGLALVGLRIT